MTDAQTPETGGEREGGTFPDPTGMNIYQRRNLAKRIARSANLRKVKGDGLKFLYLPVEQMKPVVEDAWNSAGIVLDILDTSVEDVRPAWEKTNQYGDTTWWCHQTMDLTIALVNIDDPSDRVEMTIIGEAKDNSDKIFNKLYTSALKNLYKTEFNFAESPKDDTDHDQRDAEPRRARAPTNDSFFSAKKAAPTQPQQAPPQSEDLRSKISEINKQVRDGLLTREQGAQIIEQLRQEGGQ